MNPFRLLLAAVTLALCSCAGMRAPSQHIVAPSFAPVKKSVTDAQAANDKAKTAAKKALEQVQLAQQEKQAPAQVKAELAAAVGQLNEVQAQQEQTSQALAAATSQVGTLQGQVDAETVSYNKAVDTIAKDEGTIKTQAGTIKKQAKDVWIYKGGFCSLVIAALLLVCFHLGVLGFVVRAVLAFGPWGWVALCVAGPAVIAGVFYVLFRFLP